MKTKAKTYDCVEAKQKSQEALKKEFETRQKEFASFTDFLNAKAIESPTTSEILRHFSQKPNTPGTSASCTN